MCRVLGCSWLMLLVGCLSSHGSGGGDGDAVGDGGRPGFAEGDGDGDGDGDAASTCGPCTVTDDELQWGAEPCCLPTGQCGLQADEPRVVLPVLGSMPVSTFLDLVLNMDPSLGALVVDRSPSIACMPRDQPGEMSNQCPSEHFYTADEFGSDEDAGLDEGGLDDAGIDVGYLFGAPVELHATGCCRPDGFCGYLDDTDSIGGCVRVSESLLGKALGRPDRRCSP